MTFLNPAGLWLLLGIPLVILLYILKPPVKEKAVSSTFLWKLSEKFMKKKSPFRRFRRIFLLILQIVTVLTLSLIAAKPVFLRKDCTDYILILDTSASMQMADDQGQTRLDRAKMQIGQLAKRADQGVKISLIVASDEPYVALRRTDQWSDVQAFLKNLQAGQGGCDEAEAFRLMGEISGRVVHPEVCFYTDRAGEEEPQAERFSLVNVSAADREWNVSLDSMTYKTEGKTTVFSGTLSVTGKDAGVTVGLQIDGQTVNALFVECRAGEQVSFSLEEQTADFEKALFFVETEDGLLLDNSYTVCRKDQAERSVLIVGESPFYLERLFSALEDCRLTVAKTVAAEELSGYDLYVFDGTAPAILPFDGSVLLVHPEELPNGLTFGEEKSGLFALSLGQNAPDALVSGVQTEEWTVQTFRPLSGSGLWQTVFQVEEEPVMAFKRSETGRSLAVLSFDLHDSNLPLCSSYLTFMKNLVGELSPKAVEKEEYAVGEEVRIYTARNGLLPKIRLPDGRVHSLVASKGFSAFRPLETGVYTVFWSDGDREEASLHFYVRIDREELNGRELTEAPVVPSAPENGDQTERSYAEWGWWILLALLILMLAEWGVYCYEQHGSGF